MKNPNIKKVNLIKDIRKYGWKKTWEKIKHNFIMLETPKQLLGMEIIGFKGAIIGTIFALGYLLTKGMWYICIAIAFAILIQYAGLKGKLQQREQLRQLEKIQEEYKV
jgi:hypothetical protein